MVSEDWMITILRPLTSTCPRTLPQCGAQRRLPDQGDKTDEQPLRGIQLLLSGTGPFCVGGARRNSRRLLSRLRSVERDFGQQQPIIGIVVWLVWNLYR